MITEVVLNKLEKNSKIGKIGKISKKVGDSIRKGEKILQVESVKGNTVIKSKVNGTITEIPVSEGAKVKIGDLLAKIEQTS